MKRTNLLIAFLTIFLISISLFSCQKECEHQYLTAKVIPPTCDEEGYTVNTCTVCKSEFKTDYILPTGHVMTETLFAPTCAEEGYTYYSCECGYSYSSNKIPPVGHVYTSQTFAEDCENAGYTEYTCSTCNHTYKGKFIDATGHKMKISTHPPTEDEAGYTEHTCETCGKSYRDGFVFYPDVYGTGRSENTKVIARGVDVSVWQHTKNADSTYRPLDWVAIKNAGIDYAILKIGSGKSGLDPVFEMNYRDARAAGVELGAYFYCYATTDAELLEEIELLLTLLDGKQFEYPIYFDLEDPSLENKDNKKMLTNFCITFIGKLRENGYYGALYTNKSWINDYLYGDVIRHYCDIWFAHYQTSANITLEDEFQWNYDSYGEQLGMWQYSSSGFIDGSGIAKNQPVDLNYCYKDYPSIIKKYGLNGYEVDSDIVKI